MSLIPENEAELIRLKTQMEIIRTVCPLLAILLQIIILTQNPKMQIFGIFCYLQKNKNKCK